MQFLLQNGEGIDSHNRLHVENWFSEGLAEAMVGGCSGRKVKELDYLNHLIDKHGKRSPISFKTYEQVVEWSAKQPKMAGYHFLFPMYNLAVDYILDEDGFGKSPHDLAGIFMDIAGGKDFPIAFENRVGISLAEYEEQFFDLMDSYLPEGEGVRFRSTSHIWLALVTMSLTCIICGIARSKEMRLCTRALWLLITLLYGPLSLLGFLLFRRWSRQEVTIWQRSLWESIYNVAGNALGLVLLCGAFALFLPAKDPLDFVLLAPFLVGWLVFRSPVVAVHLRTRYVGAAFRAFPVEIASTILVLTGMLTLLVTLSQHWWFSLDPRTLLFWPVLSLGATAGAIIVYPLNFWIVRRNSTTSLLGQSFDFACFGNKSS
jgi:hypothetical protein